MGHEWVAAKCKDPLSMSTVGKLGSLVLSPYTCRIIQGSLLATNCTQDEDGEVSI